MVQNGDNITQKGKDSRLFYGAALFLPGLAIVAASVFTGGARSIRLIAGIFFIVGCCTAAQALSGCCFINAFFGKQEKLKGKKGSETVADAKVAAALKRRAAIVLPSAVVVGILFTLLGMAIPTMATMSA
mmetsp:Transcript_28465/g.66106  ORF Transcript_28465/g.66106 Transcript_28465/m.66106 type:complete len:130 (-) Transcript_28465:25-414(-)